MGKLKNLINAKVSGNVGSMNFRKRGSQVVVAERSYSNSSKGAGASALQRAHRSRLANIVNFFRVISAIQARAWQTKAENVSDFNMLSKYNLATSPVFLTKQEALAHASVIAPYEVSRGSLLPLVQAFEENKFNCGVMIGGGFSFAQNTLGALSQQILDNNEGWRNGDKLSVALLTHAMVEISGLQVPKADVIYIEITLDIESSESLMAMPNMMAAQPALNADGELVFGMVCQGAFAIHSRKQNGILETSSQSIIMAPAADAIFAKYTSEGQKELAMASYGYQADVLLTPGAVVEQSAADVKIANVTSVLYGNSALANGSTIEGGQVLTITGTDMTNNNVVVNVAGVKYVPQSVTDTTRTYMLGSGGALTISVNGSVRYQCTIHVDAPAVVTLVRLGADRYQGAKSGYNASLNVDNDFEVQGEGLGALSATGCTLANIGGSETRRTASVKFPNLGSFTIMCGTTVVLAGTVTDPDDDYIQNV